MGGREAGPGDHLADAVRRILDRCSGGEGGGVAERWRGDGDDAAAVGEQRDEVGIYARGAARLRRENGRQENGRHALAFGEELNLAQIRVRAAAHFSAPPYAPPCRP
ncbi:hypothetical protein [Propylenella binzhouense]|uniref:Uncharacterized protein n=1 Tax=Propylenella binzhouense TaxID=2555902 RepID=A0A964WRX5_9HYPH|nr:hypothetical protein [Propylenella binzhouense]MYZ46250.1 hypothetical protein [Propylenella binzhouense]